MTKTDSAKEAAQSFPSIPPPIGTSITNSSEKRQTLEKLLARSLARANVFNPPWPADQVETVMSVWLTAMEPIPIDRWPEVFSFAHMSRGRAGYNKPLTVDDLLFVWGKLRANQKWSYRFEEWIDADGEFYAPPTGLINADVGDEAEN